MYNIALDLERETYLLNKAKECDDRQLSLDIFSDGVAYDLTGATIIVKGKNAIGGGITQTENITINNNNVIIELNRDFTRTPGTVSLEATIIKNGKQITTFTFNLIVKESVLTEADLEPTLVVDTIEVLENKILEAVKVKEETEELIQTGGAATKGDVASLSSQLDNNVQEIANLKNNKADITYLNTITQSIASGSPKGVYATVSDLTKTLPIGDTGIYVVSSDGGWYYWNGTSWVKGGMYQSTGIVDKSITAGKTTFMIPSKNLFDKKDIVVGRYINGTNGALEPSETHIATSFIPVTPGKTYKTIGYSNNGRAIYDANYNFISGNVSNLLIPTNGAYIRLTCINTSIDSFMVYEDEGFTPTYVPFDEVGLSTGVIITETNLPKYKYITTEKCDFLEQVVVSKNIFDKTKVINDMCVSKDNGVVVPLVGYSVSDFIEIDANSSYCTKTNGWKAIYDDKKVFIQGNGATIFTSPTNAKYLRMTTKTLDLNLEMLVKGNVLPSYEPFLTKTIMNGVSVGAKDIYDFNINSFKKRWQDKTWYALGDSITAGMATTKIYHQICQETMLCNVINGGISGTEISTSGTYPTPMVERYINIPSNVNLITVFGGTNDFGHNATLGTFTNRDASTFYGALHILCEGLYTNYPNAQFAFITPLPRSGARDGAVNSNGNTLKQYVTAIKEVCEHWSIPVLDLFKISGMCPEVQSFKTQFMPDGLHPNELGHERFAHLISSFLESL